MKVLSIEFTDPEHIRKRRKLILVNAAVPEEIRITFHSVSRNGTEYKIFASEQFQGSRLFSCAGWEGPVRERLTTALLNDLNALLPDDHTKISRHDLAHFAQEAVCLCEGKYGYTNHPDDGDFVLTLTPH